MDLGDDADIDFNENDNNMMQNEADIDEQELLEGENPQQRG